MCSGIIKEGHISAVPYQGGIHTCSGIDKEGHTCAVACSSLTKGRDRRPTSGACMTHVKGRADMCTVQWTPQYVRAAPCLTYEIRKGFPWTQSSVLQQNTGRGSTCCLTSAVQAGLLMMYDAFGRLLRMNNENMSKGSHMQHSQCVGTWTWTHLPSIWVPQTSLCHCLHAAGPFSRPITDCNTNRQTRLVAALTIAQTPTHKMASTSYAMYLQHHPAS